MSPKQARVCPILWFVFSIVLLLNMAVTPFTTSVLYAFSTDTSQSSANNSNPICYDITGDDVVNMFDFLALNIAFGSYPGHPNWNPEADLNDDNIVDIFDSVILSASAQSSVYPFWSADSYWHMKIKDNPKLHPDNDKMIDWLMDYHASYPKIQWKSWTHPIYDAYEDTPVYHVYCRDYGDYVDIPFPDPYPIQIPVEADAAVTIIDWYRGMQWSLGVVIPEGGTYSVLSYNDLPLAGQGYRTPGGPWRGGGSACPKLAYMIRPEEIEAGVIEHPLGFAARAVGPWTDGSRFDAQSGFVYPPAVHTDREVGSANPYVIPEGARIQLDPAIDLDALFGVNPTGRARTAKIIAKCLQDYGMVGVEAGGAWSIYAEHDFTAEWNPPEMSGGLLSSIAGLVTDSYNPWRVIDFDLMPTVDDLSEYE